MADRGQYFADGTRRLQRNFGITEDIAEWLRVAAFTRNVSQSELAREAFSLLRERYRGEYPAVEEHVSAKAAASQTGDA